MITPASPVGTRLTCLVGTAVAFAVLMIELCIAAPSTVVHIDGALTRVGRVVRLVGTARA